MKRGHQTKNTNRVDYRPYTQDERRTKTALTRYRARTTQTASGWYAKTASADYRPNTQDERRTKTAWVAILWFGLLNACSDNSGTDRAIDRPEQSIEGVLFVEPIEGAVVEVYSLQADSDDPNPTGAHPLTLNKPLASTTSDAEGRFSLKLQSPTIPCVVRARGGNYVEVGSGARVDVPDDQSLYAAGRCVSGNRQHKTLTWLSSLAYAYSLYLHDSGLPIDRAVTRANETISDYYGVEVSTTTPLSINNLDNLSPNLSPNLLYGLLSAALSRMTQRLSMSIYPEENIHNRIHSLAFVQMMVEDMSFDGVLNGIGTDGPLHIGDSVIDNSYYREKLSTALLSSYADPSINLAHYDIDNNSTDGNEGAGLSQGILQLRTLANQIVAPAPFHDGVNPSLDHSAPTISLAGLRDGEIIHSSRQLTADIGHSLATRQRLTIDEVEIPGGALDTWTIDPIALGEGPAVLRLVAADVYGRSASLERRFRVETNDLYLNLTSPLGERPYSGLVAIRFTVSAGQAELQPPQIRVDDSVFPLLLPDTQSNEIEFRYLLDSTQFNDGVHSVNVEVADNLGRTARQELSLLIDNSAPELIWDDTQKEIYGSRIPVCLTVMEDQLNSLTLSFAESIYPKDSFTRTNTDWCLTIELQSAQSGREELVLRATDLAGNENTIRRMIEIDNVEPVVNFEDAGERWMRSTVFLTGEIDEANLAEAELVLRSGEDTLKSWRIANAGPFRIPWETTTDVSGSGVYTATLTVNDLADNHHRAQTQWYIDNIAPRIEVDSPPDWASGELTFSGRIEEEHPASARLRLLDEEGEVAWEQALGDTGDFQIVVDSATLTPANGEFSLEVTAVDIAGNHQRVVTPWRIDNAAPRFVLAPPPEWARGEIVVSGNLVEENLAQATMRWLNDAEDVVWQDPIDRGGDFRLVFDTTTLTQSSADFTLELSATDSAGNTRRSSTTWHIDNAEPVIELSPPPDYVSDELEVRGRVHDAALKQVNLCLGVSDRPYLDSDCLVRVVILDNQKSLLDQQGNFSITLDVAELRLSDGSRLSDGNYSLVVIATDRAGNTAISQNIAANNPLDSQSAQPHRFVIDTEAPLADAQFEHRWYSREVVQIITRINDANLQSAYMCIGESGIADADSPDNACTEGFLIELTGAEAERVHLIDLNDLPPGITQGINPVTLYARDHAGNITITSEKPSSEKGVPTPLTLMIDTLDPRAGLQIPRGAQSGEISFTATVNEDNIDSVQWRLVAVGEATTDGPLQESPSTGFDVDLSSSVYDPEQARHTFMIPVDTGRFVDGDYHALLTVVDIVGQRVTVSAQFQPENVPAGNNEQTVFLRIDNTEPQAEISFHSAAEDRLYLNADYVNGALKIKGRIIEDNLATARLVFSPDDQTNSDDSVVNLIDHLNDDQSFTLTIDPDTEPGAPLIPEGDVDIVLHSTDHAGNSIQLQWRFHFDRTPPASTFTIAEHFLSGLVNIRFDINELNLLQANFQLGSNLIEVPRVSGTDTSNVTLDSREYPDGVYPVGLSALDRAGNETRTTNWTAENPASEWVDAVVIDNTPPRGELDSLNDNVRDTIQLSGILTEEYIDRAQLSICTTEAGEMNDVNPRSVIDLRGALNKNHEGDWRFNLDIDTTLLTDGSCVIAMSVTDRAGNILESTASNRQTVLIDNTAPHARLTIPDRYHNSVFLLQATVNDENLLGASLRWPACPQAQSDTPVVLDVLDRQRFEIIGQDYIWRTNDMSTRFDCLDDGQHAVELIAIDRAGNLNRVRGEFFKDSQAPTLNVMVAESFENSGHYSGDFDVEILASDDSGFTLNLYLDDIDNISEANCSQRTLGSFTAASTDTKQHSMRFSVDSTRYSDGRYVLCVVATDDVGNRILWRQSIATKGGVVTGGIHIDNRSSQAWFHIYNHWVDDELSVRLVVVENNLARLSFEILRAEAVVRRLEITPPQTQREFDQTLSVRGLAEGNYHLHLVVRELNGNVRRFDKTSELRSGAIRRATNRNSSSDIWIDRRAPSISLNAFHNSQRQPNHLVRGRISIRHSILDDHPSSATLIVTGRGVRRLLRSSTSNIVAGSYSFDTANLADGAYQLELRASDRAGHHTMRAVPIVVDNTNPVASITIPSEIQKGYIDIHWRLTEAHVKTLHLLLGVNIQEVIESDNTRYRFNTRRLADGTHPIRLQVTDQFGSRHTFSAQNSLVIDNSAPRLISTQFRHSATGASISQLDLRRNDDQKVYWVFDYRDTGSGFPTNLRSLTVYFHSRNDANQRRQSSAQCRVLESYSRLRCESAIAYSQIDIIGIENSVTAHCASTPKVIRTEHGLVASVDIPDRLGNLTRLTRTLDSPKTTRTISGYIQYSEGCFN